MTSDDSARTHAADPDRAEDEPLPSFSEQVASQLGGVRGIVESGIPIVLFVLVNIVWSLTPGVIVAVASAVAIGAYRLSRRQPVRHAINGLVGIAIGAYIAYKTGNAEDFYLPGIWYSVGYGVAMIGSVALRRPLVGWLWSIIVDEGGTRWREDTGLRRVFNWLTLLWAATYLVKAAANYAVWAADSLTHDQKSTILGVMRIALAAPPYAILLGLTIWLVRRYLRRQAEQPLPA